MTSRRGRASGQRGGGGVMTSKRSPRGGSSRGAAPFRRRFSDTNAVTAGGAGADAAGRGGKHRMRYACFDTVMNYMYVCVVGPCL